MARTTPHVVLEALHSPAAQVRALAAETLAEANMTSARPALLARAHDPNESDIVRAAAQQALAALDDEPPPTPTQSQLSILLDPQATPNDHQRAAQALAAIGDEPAASALLHAARQPNPAIQQAALAALSTLHQPAGQAVVAEALRDRQVSIRLAALQAVLAHHPHVALEALIHDPDWRVRQRLARHAPTLAISLSLLNDADAWVRQAALPRLAWWGALEPLTHTLHDPEPAVRAAAIRAWVQANPTTLAPAVRDLARDPQVVVRHTLAQALGGWPADDGIDLLDSLLRDPAPEVRAQAAAALAHLGTLAALETLLEAQNRPESVLEAQAALRTAHNHWRVVVTLSRSDQTSLRAACARLLGQWQLASTQASLRALAHDADWHVRQAAQEALSGWATPG